MAYNIKAYYLLSCVYNCDDQSYLHKMICWENWRENNIDK